MDKKPKRQSGATRTTIRHKKKNLLSALESSLGVVTTACKKAGLDRRKYYEWMAEDAEFKAAVEAIGDVAFDFVESSLYKQIQDNNVAATIFWLKTKGRAKGYSERLELTGPEGVPFAPIQITLPSMPEPRNYLDPLVGSTEVKSIGGGAPNELPLSTSGEDKEVGDSIPWTIPTFELPKSAQEAMAKYQEEQRGDGGTTHLKK